MSQVGDSDRNVSTSPSFSWWQRAAFSLLRLPLALLLLVLGDLQHLLLPVIDRILPFRRSEISGRRAARRNRINTDAGWNILKEVQRIADVTGAEVFAISGTLLGIHRNGGLLAHDVDIDVGIHLDDPRLGLLLERRLVRDDSRRAHRSFDSRRA